MASLQDIAVAAGINLFSALLFLLAFAFLRLQPINDRVYFPKWYLKGSRTSPKSSGALVKKFVNLNFKTYLKFLSWMPAALTMPEVELIDHAGLDSAVYLRIYLLGVKIFGPIAILAFVLLVPVNWTGKSLKNKKDLMFNNIDKLSISNIPPKSFRFIAHILMTYVVSLWTWYILYKEYKIVSSMRLRFLASEKRRADQFTVLVRNIPPDHDESLSEHVEDFFRSNHPDHYLTHQVVYDAGKLAGFMEKRKKMENWLTYYQTKYERKPKKKPKTRTSCWGFCGSSVDAIDYYTTKIQHFSKLEIEEREKVMSDKKSIVPAAFVSFKSRWGAAVCAQTQQTDNPTVWLTEWAPEPRDVHWDNLALPYVGLYIRRLIMAVLLFFVTFFFMIPIAFVQSLASIEGIQQVLPFLEPVIKTEAVKGLIQGFLPGIALKIFLLFLPSILMYMSKVEGLTSLSSLERRSAGKYYLFLLVNVFFGSIITGAAFEQLHSFLNQSPTEIPRTVGVAIPMKASFFITYVMVDGWAGIAAEILRLQPLAMFHFKNTFLVKTEQDREQAMDPGSLKFSQSEPQIQLYFLLGLVYAAVTPVLLPFIIIFFAFSFMVFRNQIINVYDQKYESGATFWPDVHRRIIIGLIISQLLMMGLLSTKGAARSTPLLLILPVLTIWFHRFCKGRFENAFIAFPLQNAMVKDRLENAAEPGFNLAKYLQDAYVHPVFQDDPMKILYVPNDEENIANMAYEQDNTHKASKRKSSDNDIQETVDTIYEAFDLVADAWESMETDEHSLLEIND